VRVAINAVSIGEQYTGIGTYVCGLIECLTAIGHEVIVYGSSEHIPRRKGIQIAKTSPRLTADHGSSAAVARFAWTNIALPARLKRDRADILISPSVEGSLWYRIPQIIVVHDLIPLLYPGEAPRLHVYYKRVLPLLLRRTSVVIAVSGHTRDDLVREFSLPPERVRVIYNGLSSQLVDSAASQKPAGLQSDKFFLFVGTFAPRKNLQSVLLALARVRHEISESLVIVSYPDRWYKAVLQLVADCDLSDRIAILNGLQIAEMNYLYRHATALFLLSEYEGFGYPPMEAMLCGTPAVVSNSTSLAEVAGVAAVKVDAHDIDTAAATMLRLSRDLDYRYKLGEAGVDRARQFTWARAGLELNEALPHAVER